LEASVPAIGVAEWTFLDVREAVLPASSKPAKRDLSPVISQREILRSESEVTSVLEQARRQADEIILAAQLEADEALLQIESEVEAQKTLARQQGRDEARAELGQALEAARKMVTEVETWQVELAAQGETVLVEMLKDIARKMFGEGVKLDPEILHAHLTQVMENARGLGVLKIFLNPQDARLLDPAWGEQQMLSLGEQVKIVPSGNILRGGCLVKGNVGTVDARVETQLEAILKSFAEAGQPLD
jgi:flagellar biosynthesis/type III secretory pathway protein FliH